MSKVTDATTEVGSGSWFMVHGSRLTKRDITQRLKNWGTVSDLPSLLLGIQFGLMMRRKC